jgi:hypothetical protein
MRAGWLKGRGIPGEELVDRLEKMVGRVLKPQKPAPKPKQRSN